MKKADLAETLKKASGSTRSRPAPEELKPVEPPVKRMREGAYGQPSRAGTRPITAHFPKQVRNQLKMLAVEQDRTMQELLAESLNDLFAKYGKPEIAPTDSKKQ